MDYRIIKSDELYHYGVKGMKWGVRNQRSVAGGLHRGLAGVYGINERYYTKRGNGGMAMAKRQARAQQLKKAAAADAVKQTKYANKQKAKMGKLAAKKSMEGNARRMLAKVYEINNNYYTKRGNKVLASMNAAARTEQLNKANAADERRRQKYRG